MKKSEIDKLNLRELKIALASGLRGSLYKHALARYLKMVRTEKGRG